MTVTWGMPPGGHTEGHAGPSPALPKTVPTKPPRRPPVPAQWPSVKAPLRPAEALRARRLPPPRLKRLLLPKAVVPLTPALKEAELLLTLPEMTAEQPLKPRRSLPGKECSCRLMVAGCAVGRGAGRRQEREQRALDLLPWLTP